MYGRAVDPNVQVLEALYALTGGNTELPVPVAPTLAERVEHPNLWDALHELEQLSQVRIEPPNLVLLTASGVRAMFIGRAYSERRRAAIGESQDILIEAPDETEASDEVDLGEIMDLVRENQRRPRGESGVRARTRGAKAPALEQLDALRERLEALTRDLAVSSELSMTQWSQALALRTELLRLLETFQRLVQPRA